MPVGLHMSYRCPVHNMTPYISRFANWGARCDNWPLLGGNGVILLHKMIHWLNILRYILYFVIFFFTHRTWLNFYGHNKNTIKHRSTVFHLLLLLLLAMPRVETRGPKMKRKINKDVKPRSAPTSTPCVHRYPWEQWAIVTSQLLAAGPCVYDVTIGHQLLILK